jgi:hypothetical protein
MEKETACVSTLAVKVRFLLMSSPALSNLYKTFDFSYSMNSTDKIMWRAPLNKQYLYLYPVYGRDTALSWSAIPTTRFSIIPAMSCYTGYGYQQIARIFKRLLSPGIDSKE